MSGPSETGLGCFFKVMALVVLCLFAVALWAMAWSAPGGFVLLLGVGFIACLMAALILRTVMKGSR